jgi:hypothetical protein
VANLIDVIEGYLDVVSNVRSRPPGSIVVVESASHETKVFINRRRAHG